MMPRNAKAPTIPIPFHKLLSVVAIVDEKNPLTRQLLNEIAAANFQIEVTDNLLTISGERKAETEERKEGYYRLERAFGSFSRSLMHRCPTVSNAIAPTKRMFHGTRKMNLHER